MNQYVVEGRTITVCLHCQRDISGRVLIIYWLTADGSEESVWHCHECKGEWPHERTSK